MGIYVYALNTKVRDISGVKVGVADFRYKEFSVFGGQELNQKLYNRRCAQRVAFFENHPEQLPKYFVNGPKLSHGQAVFKLKSVCFDDGGKGPTRVGMLLKDGRGWFISFTLEHQEEIK
jgi:hypothetical protein